LRISAQSASASEHKNSSSALATMSDSSSSLISVSDFGRSGLAQPPVVLGVVLGHGQASYLLDALFE
jgi:hypothetical protein